MTSDLSNDASLNDPITYIGQGCFLSKEQRYDEAELCFRQALKLNSELPMAHNNLGWILEKREAFDDAIVSYRRALQLNSQLVIAKENLALLLSRVNRYDEALPLWSSLITTGPFRLELLKAATDASLAANDLQTASRFASYIAVIRRGSRLYTLPGTSIEPPVVPDPEPMLSLGKLWHDIEQLEYLERNDILEESSVDIINAYKKALAITKTRMTSGRVPLRDELQQLIGDYFGRIIYLRNTPSLCGSVFSGAWDASVAEEACLTSSRKGLL